MSAIATKFPTTHRELLEIGRGELMRFPALSGHLCRVLGIARESAIQIHLPGKHKDIRHRVRAGRRRPAVDQHGLFPSGGFVFGGRAAR